MGSTRLPGKVLKIVDGKNPSLYFTISQLKQCKNIDKIIVATTTLKEDDIIENFAKNLGIDVFRGSVEDVLDRYFQCANYFKINTIIRITGDCPLIDSLIVDRGIEIFQSENYDYVTNTFPRTFPDGNETEIFSFNILKKAWETAILPSEREHVTPYFRNQKQNFKIKNFENTIDNSHLRWTVDFPEDLQLVKTLISKIDSRPIHLEDILHLIKSEPELIEINNDHEPNEGLKRSLEKDKDFLKNQ
jgi:spore coat polysaccharide biosynthesis protein SpsF (cytidylyltransferase family)